MHDCGVIKSHSLHFLGYFYRLTSFSLGAAFFQSFGTTFLQAFLYGGVEAVFQVAIGFAAVLVFSEFAGIELGDFGLGEGRVDVWLAVVGVDGGVVVVLWVNEGVHCFGGVVFLHEIFADEEAVVANGAQAVQSSVRADATFGDSEETVGNAADEVEGNVGVHREV